MDTIVLIGYIGLVVAVAAIVLATISLIVLHRTSHPRPAAQRRGRHGEIGSGFGNGGN